jgi:hypothetical protein
MIFSVLALTLFLRNTFAADTCTSFLISQLSSSTFCLTTIGGVQCTDDQTLFDALDPAVVCPSCSTLLSGTFATLDTMGCCSEDSIYKLSSSSGCSGEHLSYNGLSNAIDYFCSSASYLGSTEYCFSDAVDYLQTPAVQLSIQTMYATYLGQGAAAAVTYYNSASNNFNCSYVQAVECCYPTLTGFVNACGDAASQAQVAAITAAEPVISGLCALVQIPVTFTSLCSGVEAITAEECLAANDPTCDSGDDDAAPTLTAMTALIATILALAFLARKH